MLTLYVKTGCPYCARVLEVGEGLGISFDKKNVADPGVVAELVKRGGKRQTPFLVSEEEGIALYGSDAIVEYLHRTFK